PDLCLPVARKGWHALYVEMKRQKGGRLSADQRWWHWRLREQGNFVVTVAGAERGIEWVERYLGAGTLPAPEEGANDGMAADSDDQAGVLPERDARKPAGAGETLVHRSVDRR